MRPVLTVTTAATNRDLTTRDAVKTALQIADNDSDDWIDAAIERQSAVAETYCRSRFARETVSEAFRLDEGAAEYLVLARVPVVSVTSVAEDGVTVPSTEYEADNEAGLLYRLDANGYRSRWESSKSVVVVYSAGYVLPGDSGTRTLPVDLEAGVIELIRGEWFAATRDPMLRGDTIEGIGSESFWVGAAGENGAVSPRAAGYLDPYIDRRG